MCRPSGGSRRMFGLNSPPHFHWKLQNYSVDLSIFIFLNSITIHYSHSFLERVCQINKRQHSWCLFNQKYQFHWKSRGGCLDVLTNPRKCMGRIPNHIFIVDDDLCYGCGACIALCPVDVLTLESLLAIVDEPTCTHCEHCIPACPVFALEITPEIPAWIFS